MGGHCWQDGGSKDHIDTRYEYYATEQNYATAAHNSIALRFKNSFARSAMDTVMHMWAMRSRVFRSALRELTVHHKDHNHDNNPANGSNWELLCLHCHDNEHSRVLDEVVRGRGTEGQAVATHNPFADLQALLKKDSVDLAS